MLRLRIRELAILGSLLSAFLVVPCTGQTPQFCNNIDSLYPGGQYCIAATTLWSGNNPEMPVLTYQGNGDSSCNSYSYTLELDFSQPGDSYGNAQSFGLYQSGQNPGNVPWTVNWSGNQGDIGQYSEGGNGWIDLSVNGSVYDGFDFQVWGQNPTNQSVAAYIASLGAPWWYGHTLTWETLSDHRNWTGIYAPGNIQFLFGMDPTGTYLGKPDWGYPDGFGLSQLDGSPGANPNLLTDSSLWTWTTNLTYGVQVANANWMGAYFHTLNNLSQMLIDTQNAGSPPQYPAAIGGFCNFTWNGTGNNAYWNADWINRYNGGYWANWTGTAWSYGSSFNPNYTTNVCGQPSYTN